MNHLKAPVVQNILKDPENKAIFVMMSHRKLSNRELMRTVNDYAKTHKILVRGFTVTICASIR